MPQKEKNEQPVQEEYNDALEELVELHAGQKPMVRVREVSEPYVHRTYQGDDGKMVEEQRLRVVGVEVEVFHPMTREFVPVDYEPIPEGLSEDQGFKMHVASRLSAATMAEFPSSEATSEGDASRLPRKGRPPISGNVAYTRFEEGA